MVLTESPIHKPRDLDHVNTYHLICYKIGLGNNKPQLFLWAWHYITGNARYMLLVLNIFDYSTLALSLDQSILIHKNPLPMDISIALNICSNANPLLPHSNCNHDLMK